MEIELQAKLLERLVPLFDWQQVESDLLTSASLQRNVGPRTWTGPLARQPRAFLAELAIRIAKDREMAAVPAYPPARKDLPPEVASLLSELDWHDDLGKMEFTHRKPMEDMGQYLQSLRRFAKMVGIEERLDKPNDRRRHELSYHVHLSRNDGTALEAPLQAYNRLTLVRLAKAGNADELFDGERVSFYSEDLRERGAVRLLEEDHFEVRRHVMTPEEEMVELQLLFSLPEAEATERMTDMARRLLTPALATKLVELSGSEALSIVRHVRPEWLGERWFAKALVKDLVSHSDLPQDHDLFVIRVGELEESGLPVARNFHKWLRAELAKELPAVPRSFSEVKPFRDLLAILKLRQSEARPSSKPPWESAVPPEQWRFPPRGINEREQTVLDKLTGETGPDVLWLIERLPISYLAGQEGFHGFVIAAIKADAMMRLALLALYERNSASFTREQGVQLHERLCYDQNDHVRLKARQVLPWPSWMRETPSCGPSLSSLSDRAIPAERSPFTFFDRR